LDRLGDTGEVALWLFLKLLLEQREKHFLFFRTRLVEERRVAGLRLQAEMHVHGGVTAVVEDHVGMATAMPVEQLCGVIPVFGQALTLDGEYRNAGCGDRGGRMILRRIDVAGNPAD